MSLPLKLKALLVDARKALAALTLGAATAVSAGLLSGTVEDWVTGALAVATAVVVYLVPNGDSSAV